MSIITLNNTQRRLLNKIDWSNVINLDSCWPWIGSQSRGYGHLRMGHRMIYAHRISYHLYWCKSFFDIDDDYWKICHHCDNKICVNPMHLFQGTSKDNVHDALTKGRHYNHPGGESHPSAKVTDVQAEEIKLKYSQGKITQTDLGKQYNITHAQVSLIVNNKGRFRRQ